MSTSKQKINNLRKGLKMEVLIQQIPPEQLLPIISDMKTIGIAYEAGTDYRAVAKRLSQQYLGRRRTLFDGLVKHKLFEKILDNFVAGYTDAPDQPVGDAAESQQENLVENS